MDNIYINDQETRQKVYSVGRRNGSDFARVIANAMDGTIVVSFLELVRSKQELDKIDEAWTLAEQWLRGLGVIS